MRKRRTGEEFDIYGLIGVLVGGVVGILGGLWASQRLGYEDWTTFIIIFFALFGAMDGGIFGYLFDLRKNQEAAPDNTEKNYEGWNKKEPIEQGDTRRPG